MSDKLYAVEVKTTILVVGVNEAEAEEIAKDALQGEVAKEDMRTRTSKVEKLEDIGRAGWEQHDHPLDGFPSHAPVQHTCGEWVNIIEERKATEDAS